MARRHRRSYQKENYDVSPPKSKKWIKYLIYGILIIIGLVILLSLLISVYTTYKQQIKTGVLIILGAVILIVLAWVLSGAAQPRRVMTPNEKIAFEQERGRLEAQQSWRNEQTENTRRQKMAEQYQKNLKKMMWG